MFRELFSALKSEDMLDRAFSQLTEMLDHASWMFVRANDVLRNVVPVEEVRESIYRRDQAVNELERSIRRKILRHLTITPGRDVAACLALMSISKDAERIGDYCKNVFEVGRFYREGFHVAKYHEPLERVREQTNELFEKVTAAVRKSEEDEARKSLTIASDVRRQCDAVIEDLLHDDEEIEVHEAVAYSLLARHYKRVAGHLANIATAVLGRLDELDFQPE